MHQETFFLQMRNPSGRKETRAFGNKIIYIISKPVISIFKMNENADFSFLSYLLLVHR